MELAVFGLFVVNVLALAVLWRMHQRVTWLEDAVGGSADDDDDYPLGYA